MFSLVFIYRTFLNVDRFNSTCVYVSRSTFSDLDLTNLRQTIVRTTRLTITKRSFTTRKWNSARLHRHPRCRTGTWPVRRTKVKDARPIRWSLFVRFVLLLFRVCAVWSANDHQLLFFVLFSVHHRRMYRSRIPEDVDHTSSWRRLPDEHTVGNHHCQLAVRIS